MTRGLQEHSCALSSSGGLSCWGNNGNYQLAGGKAAGTYSKPFQWWPGLSAAKVAAGADAVMVIRCVRLCYFCGSAWL